MVSVIIPSRPDQSEVKAVAGARQLNYPKDKLEILVARGKQPSVQRNMAVKQARGEILYFLDDDSVPVPENLQRAMKHFARPEVKMVGGPNLCPPDAPELEQMFGVTMGTKLAFGPSCARYRSVGAARESGEKELILCNLLARRDTFLELGGFDESLYPNEENALMDKIQSQGGKLIYDPELIVHRRPRPTLQAFVKMLMTYGRGRAEQFRLHPTFGSVLNFVPPLFLVYLVSVPFLPRNLLVFLPVYLAVVLGQTLVALGPRQSFWTIHVVGLIFMSHIFYGFGFWRGLFTQPKPPPAQITTQITIDKEQP